MTTINDLSDKLLLQIFKHFKAEDLAMCLAFVNTRWKALTTNSKLWANIVFSPSHTISDRYICLCLKRMPQLRHINLKYALDVDLIMDYLCSNCPKMKTIIMHRRRGPCRQRLNKLMARYPNAECIDLHVPGTEFQMDYALWYSFHIAPKRLTLFAQNSISSKIWGCKNCEEINVYQASPQHLNTLIKEHKQDVESLALGSVLTSNTFDDISKCRELKHLFLFNLGSKGIETNFMFLQNLEKLESLQLSLWDVTYWGISAPPTKMNLNNLIKLEIAYSGWFTDACISALLMSSPSLEHLNLRTNDLNDVGLEPIKTCNHLKHIDIAFNVNLTNKSVEYIAAGCLDLTFLNLSFCFGIKDEFVDILASCIKLEELRLEHLIISPKYLHLIPVKFPNIAVIDIRHCITISNKIVRELKNEFKTLKVMACRMRHLECEEGYPDWPFIIPEDDNFDLMLEM